VRTLQGRAEAGDLGLQFFDACLLVVDRDVTRRQLGPVGALGGTAMLGKFHLVSDPCGVKGVVGL